MKTIAVVDPASFSLPYDVYRIKELASEAAIIDFYCSSSLYNEEYLSSLRNINHVTIKKFKVASPVNRFLGVSNYMKLLLILFKNRGRYDEIHFQWSIFFPIEVFFFFFLRKKLFFTFHNDVPHDFKKDKSRINEYIARVSNKIIFVSGFTYQRFLDRYGKKFSSKSIVETHPFVPLVNVSGDIMPPVEITSLPPAYKNRLIFWGNVKAYKGVERLLQLSDQNVARFNPLIIGKWDKSLGSIKSDLSSNGVEIIDEFVELDELIKYFSGNNLFILPYKEATQSGVLYTLLYYKCKVISSNVGDISEYMKSNGMSHLIFDNDKEMNDILTQFKGF